MSIGGCWSRCRAIIGWRRRSGSSNHWWEPAASPQLRDGRPTPLRSRVANRWNLSSTLSPPPVPRPSVAWPSPRRGRVPSRKRMINRPARRPGRRTTPCRSAPSSARKAPSRHPRPRLLRPRPQRLRRVTLSPSISSSVERTLRGAGSQSSGRTTPALRPGRRSRPVPELAEESQEVNAHRRSERPESQSAGCARAGAVRTTTLAELEKMVRDEAAPARRLD